MLDYVDLTEYLAISPDSLTARQRDAVNEHLTALTAALARELNRPLDIEEFTQSAYITERWATVPLDHTPVVEILGYSINGVAATLTPMPSAAAWAEMYWSYDTNVEVRYLAGIDAAADAHLRGVLLDKATPYLLTLRARDAARTSTGESTQAVSGLVVPAPPPGVKQFAVEGLNVTFQSDAERQAAELDLALKRLAAVRWTPEELAGVGLSRLRKRVVA